MEINALAQHDPNDPTQLPPGTPVYTETVETTVVRESSTGWWIAGILGGAVMIAVLWILFARGPNPQTDEALLQAQANAAAAQAQADSALIQGQIQGQVAGAQASVEIARAEAARSQAEAVRANSEARAAEARAATPVIIEREVPAPGPVVVTPPVPQN